MSCKNKIMVDWLAYYANELIMVVKSFTTQAHYGVLMIILQNQPNIQNVITAFLIIFLWKRFQKTNLKWNRDYFIPIYYRGRHYKGAEIFKDKYLGIFHYSRYIQCLKTDGLVTLDVNKKWGHSGGRLAGKKWHYLGAS